jgi:hypothetical protein
MPKAPPRIASRTTARIVSSCVALGIPGACPIT